MSDTFTPENKPKFVYFLRLLLATGAHGNPPFRRLELLQGTPQQCQHTCQTNMLTVLFLFTFYATDVKFLSKVEDFVSTHRGKLIPLTKPAGYSLRIGSLQDTVHAESEDQLQVWEDCYLPDRMKMVVLGVLDDCSAADGQLVLLLCQDGNVYAYEFEVLHLVASSLKDLLDSGVEFPGQKSYKFGDCFNDVVRNTDVLG